ncbi:MAG: aromatic acid exporter family protein [Clostridiaceae bacterium]|nr:aromatic acid exporter family protein [Clostridiaceae bacterium]
MKKILNIETIKRALSASTAIFIANILSINYGVTAGIIAVLGIQDTKKETFRVAGRRIIAAVTSILISYGLFLVFGSSPLIFGLFLLIYIPLTKLLKIEDGMVVGAVLSTHLLSSTNLSLMWIENEIKLTFVGVIVSIIYNLYMPSLDNEYEKRKELIEKNFGILLSNMAQSLMTKSVCIYDEKILNEVSMHIKENTDISYKIKDNFLFKKEEAAVKYMDMRSSQLETIKRMRKHFARFYMTYNQTKILSDFTNKVANNIYEDNDCRELLENLNMLRDDYKRMELPTSREEFENRALLFQFLNDLEDFLLIKREFKMNMN